MRYLFMIDGEQLNMRIYFDLKANFNKNQYKY